MNIYLFCFHLTIHSYLASFLFRIKLYHHPAFLLPWMT
jgi:hypothetical protein